MNRLVRDVGTALVVTLAAFTVVVGLMTSAVALWLDRGKP